jgi:hypothetical protein
LFEQFGQQGDNEGHVVLVGADIGVWDVDEKGGDVVLAGG